MRIPRVKPGGDDRGTGGLKATNAVGPYFPSQLRKSVLVPPASANIWVSLVVAA